jgi:hypothetical protein
MTLNTLPIELVNYIYKFLTIYDAKNLSLTNSKMYKIYNELKEKEKTYYINEKLNIRDLGSYISNGFRYIQIKENIEKIINVTHHFNKKQISFFFISGNHIFINMDYFEVRKIEITYHNKKNNEKVNNIKLIIESPFIIKCKIINGINEKLENIFRQE